GHARCLCNGCAARARGQAGGPAAHEHRGVGARARCRRRRALPLSALPRLHLVTDDVVLADRAFPELLERVLDGCGAVAALHLRGHHTAAARLTSIGDAAAAAALRHGAWLLVNDRIDVARAVRANGVMLGARSLGPADARALLGAGARIGASV